MDTYSLLREIADSWGLLAMMIFFIGAVLMLFRPGANKMHKDASEIPFRENEPNLRDNAGSKRPKSEQPLEG